jgi:hypothetical protein
MRITVFGKGHVGGGLADLWERAGPEVSRLGREGGDVSDTEVVLVAIPGGEVATGLGRLTGLEGKTVIDATNRYGVDPPSGFASNAEFIKSVELSCAALHQLCTPICGLLRICTEHSSRHGLRDASPPFLDSNPGREATPGRSARGWPSSPGRTRCHAATGRLSNGDRPGRGGKNLQRITIRDADRGVVRAR